MGGPILNPATVVQSNHPVKAKRREQNKCVLHEQRCSRGTLQFTEMAETADIMEVSWSYFKAI